MTKVTIYQKPACTTCRRVYTALKESGVDFDAVDYYIEPIPKTKLKELLSKMGMRAHDLLRKKGFYEVGANRDLPLQAEKDLSEEEILDLMVKYPNLIQRPIVEKGSNAILARPAERLKEIL